MIHRVFNSSFPRNEADKNRTPVVELEPISDLKSAGVKFVKANKSKGHRNKFVKVRATSSPKSPKLNNIFEKIAAGMPEKSKAVTSPSHTTVSPKTKKSIAKKTNLLPFSSINSSRYKRKSSSVSPSAKSESGNSYEFSSSSSVSPSSSSSSRTGKTSNGESPNAKRSRLDITTLFTPVTSPYRTRSKGENSCQDSEMLYETRASQDKHTENKKLIKSEIKIGEKGVGDPEITYIDGLKFVCHDLRDNCDESDIDTLMSQYIDAFDGSDSSSDENDDLVSAKQLSKFSNNGDKGKASSSQSSAIFDANHYLDHKEGYEENFVEDSDKVLASKRKKLKPLLLTSYVYGETFTNDSSELMYDPFTYMSGVQIPEIESAFVKLCEQTLFKLEKAKRLEPKFDFLQINNALASEAVSALSVIGHKRKPVSSSVDCKTSGKDSPLSENVVSNECKRTVDCKVKDGADENVDNAFPKISKTMATHAVEALDVTTDIADESVRSQPEDNGSVGKNVKNHSTSVKLLVKSEPKLLKNYEQRNRTCQMLADDNKLATFSSNSQMNCSKRKVNSSSCEQPLFSVVDSSHDESVHKSLVRNVKSVYKLVTTASNNKNKPEEMCKSSVDMANARVSLRKLDPYSVIDAVDTTISRSFNVEASVRPTKAGRISKVPARYLDADFDVELPNVIQIFENAKCPKPPVNAKTYIQAKIEQSKSSATKIRNKLNNQLKPSPVDIVAAKLFGKNLADKATPSPADIVAAKLSGSTQSTSTEMKDLNDALVRNGAHKPSSTSVSDVKFNTIEERIGEKTVPAWHSNKSISEVEGVNNSPEESNLKDPSYVKHSIDNQVALVSFKMDVKPCDELPENLVYIVPDKDIMCSSKHNIPDDSIDLAIDELGRKFVKPRFATAQQMECKPDFPKFLLVNDAGSSKESKDCESISVPVTQTIDKVAEMTGGNNEQQSDLSCSSSGLGQFSIALKDENLNLIKDDNERVSVEHCYNLPQKWLTFHVEPRNNLVSQKVFTKPSSSSESESDDNESNDAISVGSETDIQNFKLSSMPLPMKMIKNEGERERRQQLAVLFKSLGQACGLRQRASKVFILTKAKELMMGLEQLDRSSMSSLKRLQLEKVELLLKKNALIQSALKHGMNLKAEMFQSSGNVNGGSTGVEQNITDNNSHLLFNKSGNKMHIINPSDNFNVKRTVPIKGEFFNLGSLSRTTVNSQKCRSIFVNKRVTSNPDNSLMQSSTIGVSAHLENPSTVTSYDKIETISSVSNASNEYTPVRRSKYNETKSTAVTDKEDISFNQMMFKKNILTSKLAVQLENLRKQKEALMKGKTLSKTNQDDTNGIKNRQSDVSSVAESDINHNVNNCIADNSLVNSVVTSSPSCFVASNLDCCCTNSFCECSVSDNQVLEPQIVSVSSISTEEFLLTPS